MAYCIPFKVSIFIKPSALMQDMLSHFDEVYTTQTVEAFPREKPQPIFAYWSMICNCSCYSHIQRVRMTKKFKPYTIFDIRQFNKIVIIII